MRIRLIVVLTFLAICTYAQPDIVGKWRFSSLTHNNKELRSKKKDRDTYLFNPDKTYTKSYYLAEMDLQSEDKNAKVKKIRMVNFDEKGKYEIDTSSTEIHFTSGTFKYSRNYYFENDKLIIVESYGKDRVPVKYLRIK